MKNEVGIYQLENGKWAYRLVFNRNGKKTNYRRKTDGNGNPLKSKAQAMRARDSLLIELNKDVGKKPIEKRTLGEVHLLFIGVMGTTIFMLTAITKTSSDTFELIVWKASKN